MARTTASATATSSLPPRLLWTTAAHWIAATVAAAVVLLAVPRRAGGDTAPWPVGVAVLVALAAVAWRWLPARVPVGRFGPANAVTLVRATGAAILAAFVGEPGALAIDGWWPFALGAVLLGLDGVDGWAARRSGTASPFGARLDMEVDAFLLLVLSALVWRLDLVGPWVLGIGAMRYGWIAASWRWPPLARPLPESLRRKTVCVVQGVALVACLAPVVAPPLPAALCATALGLLAWSFGVDARRALAAG
jgi:phosphatidylglycerophosphate synthase